MPIGSFVNGVFNGMSIRDARTDRKRSQGMEDTRFEREGVDFERQGEVHDWRRQSHEMAMERARRAKGKGRVPSMNDTIRDYGNAGGVADSGYQGQYAPAPVANPMGGFGGMGSGAPLSYAPREMSALQAVQPVQTAQAMPASQGGPMEFDFIPGQGLMPRGVA